MTWLRVEKYVSTKSLGLTKRIAKKKPRVFKMHELDGFYVDNELDRTLHITIEDRDVIVIDVYDTEKAACEPTGEPIGIIELNLNTGKAKFFREGR